MFGIPKTLIVVYKDEMLMNQLKKMVETNDDKGEDQIVGTTDGSINIVSWNEKVWLGNKKAGNIKDKVLFLGDIKGIDKLTPVIDVQFDEFGVKFGWAGNQAVLFADPKELNDKEKYASFIKAIETYPVPDMVKKSQNYKSEEIKESEDQVTDDLHDKEDKRKIPAILQKAKETITTGTDAVEKAGKKVVEKAGEVFRDKNAVRRQMLFYGVVNLYNKGLEEFMNM